MTWIASTDNVGVTGYTVALGHGIPLPTGVPRFNFTGLNENTDYTVSIKAHDAAGNSSTPATVTFRTVQPPITGPVNFRGQAYKDSVQFYWDSFPGAISYELNRLGSIAPVGRTTGTTLLVEKLAPGVLRYNVVAVLQNGKKSERSEYLWIGPPN